MKKKLLSVLLSACLLCIVPVSVFAYEIEEFDFNEHKDTFEVSSKPSSWATETVNQAISQGFVPEFLQVGYTQTITRQEFCELAVILYEKMMGAEIQERASFDDTKNLAVQKMGGLGVVSGVGNNKFDPNALLTREQAAVILSNLCGSLGKSLDSYETTFADKANISSWAVESVGKIQLSEIMRGVGNNEFSPKGSYTREQSIITMINVYNYFK